jgi:hypothetical protein
MRSAITVVVGLVLGIAMLAIRRWLSSAPAHGPPPTGPCLTL